MNKTIFLVYEEFNFNLTGLYVEIIWLSNRKISLVINGGITWRNQYKVYLRRK